MSDQSEVYFRSSYVLPRIEQRLIAYKLLLRSRYLSEPISMDRRLHRQTPPISSSFSLAFSGVSRYSKGVENNGEK